MVFKQIQDERAQQDKQWGEQNHGDLYWLGILVEEVGEIAKAIIEERPIDTELIQVAAVAVAWFECIQRRIK